MPVVHPFSLVFTAFGNGVGLLTTGSHEGTVLTVLTVVVVELPKAANQAACLACFYYSLLILLFSLASAFHVAHGEVRLLVHTLDVVVVVELGKRRVPCQFVIGNVVLLVVVVDVVDVDGLTG